MNEMPVIGSINYYTLKGEIKKKIYLPMVVNVCRVSTEFYLPREMGFILNDKILEKLLVKMSIFLLCFIEYKINCQQRANK